MTTKEISDKAREYAKETKHFFTGTIENYVLRAKNAFQQGFIQGYNQAVKELNSIDFTKSDEIVRGEEGGEA